MTPSSSSSSSSCWIGSLWGKTSVCGFKMIQNCSKWLTCVSFCWGASLEILQHDTWWEQQSPWLHLRREYTRDTNGAAKVNRMKEYNKEYSIKDIWNHLESRTMQEWPCPLQWQCCPDSIGCAERKFDKATSPSASWCRGRPKNHDLYINVAADMCFTYRQFDYMYLYIIINIYNYIYIYIHTYVHITLCVCACVTCERMKQPS